MDRWTPQDVADYQARRGLKIEIVDSPKPSKYRSRRTTIDNIEFASKREAARYQELRIMEREGLITGLTLQPRYPLIVEGKKICTFVGDFRYLENGKLVVEDAKGVRTPVYKIKRRLMDALYGIQIRET